ncbi:MAG: hypothetical protein JWM76_278 [Pseudonocardiales bacterium]|nr:hypothetical protein [Pseudonocardiales bacterium]
MTHTDLRARFGLAQRPDRPVTHERPPAATDDEIDAAGKLSAAFETVEAARGHLYNFHRMSGTADRELQEAVAALRKAGADELADQIADVLVGRDIVDGLWSFQLVERYDTQYYEAFRAAKELVEQQLTGGTPHVLEAEMKGDEQRPR